MAMNMKTNRKRTRKNQSLTLATASQAVGTAMGRAVGRVERMMKLARQRMAGRTAAGAKKRSARSGRQSARNRA